MFYTADDIQLVMIALQGPSLEREFHRNIFPLTEMHKKFYRPRKINQTKCGAISHNWIS